MDHGFNRDVEFLTEEAIHTGLLAKRDAFAANFQHVGNSRFAFVLTEVVEKTGDQLITGLADRFELTVSDGRRDVSALQTFALQGLERFLASTKAWGDVDPAFPSDRSYLYASELDNVIGRLRERLAFKLRGIRPTKRDSWTKATGDVFTNAWGTVLGTGVIAAIGFVWLLLTKIVHR